MIEKFSDYEGTQYLAKAGTFKFTVKEYELATSKKGDPMAKLVVSCDEGETTVYHSLDPKARWSYNNLIKACLHLNTPEKRAAFELDYQTIGNDLIGKTFMGNVEVQTYDKEIAVPQEDGTYKRSIETKESYKIVEYFECAD